MSDGHFSDDSTLLVIVITATREGTVVTLLYIYIRSCKYEEGARMKKLFAYFSAEWSPFVVYASRACRTAKSETAAQQHALIKCNAGGLFVSSSGSNAHMCRICSLAEKRTLAKQTVMRELLHSLYMRDPISSADHHATLTCYSVSTCNLHHHRPLREVLLLHVRQSARITCL